MAGLWNDPYKDYNSGVMNRFNPRKQKLGKALKMMGVKIKSKGPKMGGRKTYNGGFPYPNNFQ